MEADKKFDTTGGDDRVLGTSCALKADEEALTEAAYSRFRQEAHYVSPYYAPHTVSINDWKATHAGMTTIYRTNGSGHLQK